MTVKEALAFLAGQDPEAAVFVERFNSHEEPRRDELKRIVVETASDSETVVLLQ